MARIEVRRRERLEARRRRDLELAEALRRSVTCQRCRRAPTACAAWFEAAGTRRLIAVCWPCARELRPQHLTVPDDERDAARTNRGSE
jgi:hypothetical protein